MRKQTMKPAKEKDRLHTPPWSVTVLGSGTSSGVPIIGCKCSTCRSKDPRDLRSRSSIYLRSKQGAGLLIDPSIDLRIQCLQWKVPRVDAVLITHPHNDHIGGLDDLRAFNYLQNQAIPVYGNAWTKQSLFNRYDYIFAPKKIHLGGGISNLTFTLLPDEVSQVSVAGLNVETIPLDHGGQPCLGFKFREFAYLTDFKKISDQSLSALKGVKTLILDCVRLTPHKTHLNLEEALWVASQINPTRTYLTHLGHEFKHATYSKKTQNRLLPKGVFLAYDGLTLKNCV